MATNPSLPMPEFLPCLISEDLSKFEPRHRPSDNWPPPWALSEKETDRLLAKQSLTSVRRILDYFYGRTADLRWDGFQHLANICTKMALGRGAVWYQRPFVKFIAPVGQPKDPENYDPRYSLARKRSTCHWFQTHLGEAISKYSPEQITKRELMELARMGDRRARGRHNGQKLATLEEDDLLHLCNALVCDMITFGQKEAMCELPPDPGVRIEEIAAPIPQKPDYSAAALLVSSPPLRKALGKLTATTMEATLRKLDAGMEANEALESVAQDLNRTKQTVRKNLIKAKSIVAGIDAQARLLHLLAGLVLPDSPKNYASPTAPHTFADERDYQLPENLAHLDGACQA